MTWLIRVPASYEPERRYAAEVLFDTFLGLRAEILVESRSDTLISSTDSKATLSVADGLFALPQQQWLTPESVPVDAVDQWQPGEDNLAARLVDERIPVLFGNQRAGSRFHLDPDGHAKLDLDVFGTVFFYLSRYEEATSAELDYVERYPFEASIDYRAKTIERPLVNEYAELLFVAMLRIWPDIKRRSRAPRLLLSHDVDLPFRHAFTSAGRMLLSCGADCLRRGDPAAAFRRVAEWVRTKGGNRQADPANTFDAIMQESERLGVQSEFNFICARTHPTMDCNYDLEHPWITDLMLDINRRGHRVGLHGSFNSTLDSSRLSHEFAVLRDVCARLGIDQEQWGARQHWLRWRTPETFTYLEAAGVDYDSTLTYEQSAGFRCGTCYEYPVFDLAGRQRLKLRERPLIVMDCSITEAMGLGMGDRAKAAIQKLKERCFMFNGDFTLLWHNSRLSPPEWQLYRAVLATVAT